MESKDLALNQFFESNLVSSGDKLLQFGDEDDPNVGAVFVRRKEVFTTPGKFIGYYTHINRGNVINGRLHIFTQPDEIFLADMWRMNARTPYGFCVDPFSMNYKFATETATEMTGMGLNYSSDYDKLAYAVSTGTEAIIDDNTWSYAYVLNAGVTGLYSAGHGTQPTPHTNPVSQIPPGHNSKVGDAVPHTMYSLNLVKFNLRIFKPCRGTDPTISETMELEESLREEIM